jgi:uncharacterized protein YegJ (DUF2314 family)
MMRALAAVLCGFLLLQGCKQKEADAAPAAPQASNAKPAPSKPATKPVVKPSTAPAKAPPPPALPKPADASHPLMLEARAKARDQFPAFAGAFGQSQDKSSFAALASFGATNGKRESVWVRVNSLVGTTISGTILTPPTLDIGHKAGERVTVAIEQVQDWTYAIDATTFGLFTLKAQEAIDKERGDR